jgi:hypothetical protein
MVAVRRQSMDLGVLLNMWDVRSRTWLQAPPLRTPTIRPRAGTRAGAEASAVRRMRVSGDTGSSDDWSRHDQRRTILAGNDHWTNGGFELAFDRELHGREERTARRGGREPMLRRTGSA